MLFVQHLKFSFLNDGRISCMALSHIETVTRKRDKDKEERHKQVDVAESISSSKCADREVCRCTVRLKADVPLAQDKNKRHLLEAFW